MLGEKAEGDVTFSSVFKKKVSHKTGPRVLEGHSPAEPAVPKGQEYLIPPDKDNAVPPVPVFSRLKLLGPSLTRRTMPAFARNIVNRLWALLMGRGIVHPLDLHHDDNPPSNPELLDLLASQFVAMKYDIKAFLREIALTRAYKRSSEPPPDSSPELAEPRHFAVAGLRPASPEQLAWSVMQGRGPGGADQEGRGVEARRRRPADEGHPGALRQEPGPARGRRRGEGLYQPRAQRRHRSSLTLAAWPASRNRTPRQPRPSTRPFSSPTASRSRAGSIPAAAGWSAG